MATNSASWVMERVLQKVTVPVCQTSWWEYEGELNRVFPLEFLPLGYLSYLINCERSFSMLFQFTKQKKPLEHMSNCYIILETRIKESNGFSKMLYLVRDLELELIYKVRNIL